MYVAMVQLGCFEKDDAIGAMNFNRDDAQYMINAIQRKSRILNNNKRVSALQNVIYILL